MAKPKKGKVPPQFAKFLKTKKKGTKKAAKKRK